MNVEGTLEGIQRYTIHGGPYARLFFSHADDPETIIQAQLLLLHCETSQRDVRACAVAVEHGH